MDELTLKEKIKAFPVLTYSRVCGWIVPFKQMNKGKRAEKNDQKYYKYDKKDA